MQCVARRAVLRSQATVVDAPVPVAVRKGDGGWVAGRAGDKSAVSFGCCGNPSDQQIEVRRALKCLFKRREAANANTEQRRWR